MNLEDVSAYIKKYFTVDENGKIHRSDRKNSNGSLDTYGYLILKIKGKQYKAHRVAWLLYYGAWPKDIIDHIDGDKLNNKKSNLRDVKCLVNVINTKRNIGCDNTTKGLRAKYNFQFNKKTYRFRSEKEATKQREMLHATVLN